MPAPKASRDQIIAALRRCNGMRIDAAKELGMSYSALRKRVKDMLDEGITVPVSDYQEDRKNAMYRDFHAPDGFAVKGVSQLLGPDGNIKLQWVKSQADEQAQKQALDATIAALSVDLPRQPPIAAPSQTIASLCNLYTITDAHVGMHAWDRESGEDWDLKIAERVIGGAFSYMIDNSPPAKLGIVNQMGDMLHTDGFKALTPEHGHLLDADSRYPKMVEVTIRILRRIVNKSLEKHERVIVNMLDANHDPQGEIWLRSLFAVVYENDPRVTVCNSPNPFVAHQWGRVMLAFHHGHCVKLQALPLLFATQFSEMWGATTKRYCHAGHKHHCDEKEYPGMQVIQHPTLAPKDAYAARGGFLSERAATCITYHEEYGQVARQTVVPEMLAA